MAKMAKKKPTKAKAMGGKGAKMGKMMVPKAKGAKSAKVKKDNM
jgi:hypothetical protein